jgi:LruC domain-containing protein
MSYLNRSLAGLTSALLFGSALSLGATAAQAEPSVSLTYTAKNPDGSTVNGSNYLTGTTFTLNVQYSITGLTTAAFLEFDLCSPGSTYWSNISGGDIEWGNLPSCQDAYGNGGLRIAGPGIPAPAGGGDVAVTGVFSIGFDFPPDFNANGSVWSIPVRMMAGTPGMGTPLKEQPFSIVGHTTNIPGLHASIQTLTTGPSPDSLHTPGYLATYAIQPFLNFFNYGAYPETGTQVVGTVPAGAQFVSNTMPVYVAPSSAVGPILVAESATDFNTHQHLTLQHDGSGNVVSYTYSVDQMLTFGVENAYTVTLWYPIETPSTTISSTITASWDGAAPITITPNTLIGMSRIAGYKQHLWERAGVFTNFAAHNPTYADHLQNYSTPGDLLTWYVELFGTSALVNPEVIDVLPPHVVALDVTGLTIGNIIGYGGDQDISAQVSISYSSDPGCGPLTATWTPVAQHDAATLASARCLKFSASGIFQSAFFVKYTGFLQAGARDALNATPGAYEFEDNYAYLSAANSNSNEAPWSVNGSYEEMIDRSTVWNISVANADTEPAAFGYPRATIGSDFNVEGEVPYGGATPIYSTLGFTDLSFAGTLPLDLDLTGAPFPDPRYVMPIAEDGSTMAPPVCTWSAQDRSTTPITPATWSCTFPGHYRGSRQDPLSAAGCSTVYLSCTDDYARKDSSGQPIYNPYHFYLPEVIRNGYQGQQITQPIYAWSTMPAAPDGTTQPASSLANASVVNNDEITVNGVQQLTLTKTAASSTTTPHGTVAYDLRYHNSGAVATTGLHIYDLFGRDSTTGALLSGCEMPYLSSVQVESPGAAPVIEYTTSTSPTPSNAAGWTPVLPADLHTVTGVRITPTSNFDPTAGVYGPADPAGHVAVTLADSVGAGATMCNAASVVADGYTLSGASALPSSVVANCSTTVYSPAQATHGTLLFEDRWPANGDLDFNDQSIAYNYQFILDPQQRVTALQANINVLAVGATIHNGLYLHLPLTRGAVAGATFTLVDSAGNTRALTPVDGETDLVLELVADTRDLFARQDTFINTQANVAAQQGTAFHVTIQFATPTVLDVSLVPYDLFIAQTANYRHQIHQEIYPGTDRMDTALFGHQDDRSTLAQHFINEHGLPFAIAVPDALVWPLETLSLGQLYGHLADFAATGGGSADWYKAAVDLTKAFVHGGGQAAPAPIMVGPELQISCE